jgi:hypothetical protein
MFCLLGHRFKPVDAGKAIGLLKEIFPENLQFKITYQLSTQERDSSQ